MRLGWENLKNYSVNFYANPISRQSNVVLLKCDVNPMQRKGNGTSYKSDVNPIGRQSN